MVFKKYANSSCRPKASEILGSNPTCRSTTNTLLAPFIVFDLRIQFDFLYFVQRTRVRSKQTNPSILGSIIILYRLITQFQFRSYKHYIWLLTKEQYNLKTSSARFSWFRAESTTAPDKHVCAISMIRSSSVINLIWLCILQLLI
jgi:hypothetical protein